MALNEMEVNLIFFLRSEGYLLSDYLPPKKIKFDLGPLSISIFKEFTIHVLSFERLLK